MAISDRVPPVGRRDLLLLGQAGTVKLEENAYDFRDGEGRVIDSSLGGGAAGERGSAVGTLPGVSGAFFAAAIRSPHRGGGSIGWREISSDNGGDDCRNHRTGQGESPERFRGLRR